MPKNNGFLSRQDLRNLLHLGLLEMDLYLSEVMEVQLIKYIELIDQWNKLFKLSSIVDKASMVTRHLLDSLSLVPFIKGNFIVDVGTGAGFPGMPLAMAMPKSEFLLIDTNMKKTHFLKLACRELQLRNVWVVHQPVEDYSPNVLFDTVISRSFGTLHDFLRLSQHLVKPNGQMLAMKGVYPLTELEEVPAKFKFVEAVPIEVAGVNAERHIIEFCYMPQKNTVETA